MAKRQTIAAETKVKVALAALRAEKTINQIASDFGVHPVQISQWKRELVENAQDLFRDKRTRSESDRERLVAELYQQIGQLQYELNWLKKKVGLDDR
jgi:transposase-like protein